MTRVCALLTESLGFFADSHTQRGPHITWTYKDSGQISIIPDPEFCGDFEEVPLLNHYLGWLLGGKRRYNLPRKIKVIT